MENRLRIALIYGSTREGRLCDTIVDWTAAQLERLGHCQLDLIDPAAPDAVNQRLERADGFIVITPEYNHGYPAPLKALIDTTGSGWQAKPVGFVSYGGVSGGSRAVEQLRQVFAEMHSVTLRDSVSFINVWEQFEDGQLRDPARAERSLKRMFTHLHWWADSLRRARARVPYGEIGETAA